MKSPLLYASRCLSHIEDHWMPCSSLWWRFWTPRIPRDDRYQDGAFSGYAVDDDESLSDLPLLDIRRMLAVPILRTIYKKLPYIDVVPVNPPYAQMTPYERSRRDAFVTRSTMAAYESGQAFYRRETIASIEAQLTAAAATLARRRKDDDPHSPRRRPRTRIRHTLFSHCEAPQTAFLSFPALDGVTTHVATLAPGAELRTAAAAAAAAEAAAAADDNDDGEVVFFFRAGRAQIEFRALQELVQPDPALRHALGEQFAPDSWVPSAAYHPLRVAPRSPVEWMAESCGEEEGVAQVGWDGLWERLAVMKWWVREAGEWKGVVEGLGGVEGGVLREVDKVVFFYANGLTDGFEYCARAMFLFALAACLREWVQALGGRAVRSVPILMPAFDVARRWNAAEEAFLGANGVVLVESNGELFLSVDERTLVVSYRSWNPVKQVVADLARPAVLICRTVCEDPLQDFRWKDEWVDGERVKVPTVRSRFLDPQSIMADPDSPRVRTLVEDYDRYPLPGLPGDGEPPEDMSLYIRKPGASTEVEYS